MQISLRHSGLHRNTHKRMCVCICMCVFLFDVHVSFDLLTKLVCMIYGYYLIRCCISCIAVRIAKFGIKSVEAKGRSTMNEKNKNQSDDIHRNHYSLFVVTGKRTGCMMFKPVFN